MVKLANLPFISAILVDCRFASASRGRPEKDMYSGLENDNHGWGMNMNDGTLYQGQCSSFPQWHELEEALQNMPMADVYYTLPSDVGHELSSRIIEQADIVSVPVQQSSRELDELSSRERNAKEKEDATTVGYCCYNGSYEDLYDDDCDENMEYQGSASLEDESSGSDNYALHSTSYIPVEDKNNISSDLRDRRLYFKEYNQRRKERHTPYWRWLIENKSKKVIKMIGIVSACNGISQKMARTRLEQQLTEKLQDGLLSRDAMTRKAALHIFDFKSPEELLSESEKTIFFKDYYKKPNGDVYKAPKQILRTASLHLTESEKHFIKQTIFKTPQDYEKIVVMIKKAIHEARLQDWQGKRDSLAVQDV